MRERLRRGRCLWPEGPRCPLMVRSAAPELNFCDACQARRVSNHEAGMVRTCRVGKTLVLPDRIELSTSPLPRECSTTELRQQMQQGLALGAATGRGRFLPQGPRRRKRGSPGFRGKTPAPSPEIPPTPFESDRICPRGTICPSLPLGQLSHHRLRRTSPTGQATSRGTEPTVCVAIPPWLSRPQHRLLGLW